MNVYEEWLTAADGEQIFLRQWPALEAPRGTFLLVHGMAEHGGRYGQLARFLTAHGFNVAAPDHRGHGQTARTDERLGILAAEGGWEKVIDDIHMVVNHLPEKPLFILGHSMGSFLARRYVQRYPAPSGLIMTGTGTDKGLLSWLGLGLVKLIRHYKGPQVRSRLLNFLAFGLFNRPFRPARTPFDWLTRDEAIVDNYMADPLCGTISSASFFYDLFTGLKPLDSPQNIALIPRELPILLLSGAEDPVGEQGKAVQKVYGALQAAGLSDVTLKLYAQGRHEILNELNREDVYEELLRWVEKRL